MLGGSGEEAEEEGLFRKRRRGSPGAAAVQPLRRPEDPTVANGASRGENAVQRLWGPVQVGSALTRIQARLQPNVLERVALEPPPEGTGDAAEEGDDRWG